MSEVINSIKRGWPQAELGLACKEGSQSNGVLEIANMVLLTYSVNKYIVIEVFNIFVNNFVSCTYSFMLRLW